MKLEKAIEIDERIVSDFYASSPQEDKDALKLGIEALKDILRNRTHKYLSDAWILPGETKD
jgi:hypothetical protein